MSLIAAMEAAVAEVEGKTVTVEGSTKDGLCSSSSSDSEDEVHAGFGVPATASGFHDDDDEEIEYGDGKANSSTVQRPPAPPASTSTFSTPAQAPAYTPPQPSSTTSAFGIVYKPMRPAQAEPYADAKRQKELDALLEEEARSTEATSIFSLQTAVQDDDDFDAPGPVAATLAPALDEVLQRAQQLRIQEAAVAPPIVAAQHAFTEEAEEEGVEEVVGKEEDKGEGQGLWEAAEAALTQLTDTYARGFGDVEVRAMQDDVAGARAEAVAPPSVGQVTGMTISEGDEEEAEMQEAQEEAAAAKQKLEEEERAASLASEWDSLAPPTSRAKGRLASAPTVEDSRISYDEVMAHFVAKYTDPKPATPAAASGAKGGMAWLSLGGGAVTLNAEEGRERDRLLAMSEEHWDPTDPIHYRLIRTVYKGMTGRSNCPMTGSHWEALGFQGTDPRTDLNRSMGVFSLVQALRFLEGNELLARALFHQSQDDVAHWPYLLVSINLTRDAVQALRDGVVNRECRRRGSVADVVHGVHQALFYDFHVRLAAQPTVHHAVHLSAGRAAASKDIMALDKKYQAQLKKGTGGVVVKAVSTQVQGGEDVFTVLEEAQETDVSVSGTATVGGTSKKHFAGKA